MQIFFSETSNSKKTLSSTRAKKNPLKIMRVLRQKHPKNVVLESVNELIKDTSDIFQLS